MLYTLRISATKIRDYATVFQDSGTKCQQSWIMLLCDAMQWKAQWHMLQTSLFTIDVSLGLVAQWFVHWQYSHRFEFNPRHKLVLSHSFFLVPLGFYNVTMIF